MPRFALDIRTVTIRRPERFPVLIDKGDLVNIHFVDGADFNAIVIERIFSAVVNQRPFVSAAVFVEINPAFLIVTDAFQVICIVARPSFKIENDVDVSLSFLIRAVRADFAYINVNLVGPLFDIESHVARS